MTGVDQRARFATLTAGGRAFALVMLALPVAVAQDYITVIGAILLAAVWVCAVFTDGVRAIPAMPALVVETSLVTFIVCLSLEASTVLLAALVVPPFIAGVTRAFVGVAEVIGAQVVIGLATIVPSSQITANGALVSALATWLMAGVGLGLIGTFIHRSRSEEAVTSSYRDARRLLVQFRELSGDLVEGLDPVAIANHILGVCRHHLPFAGVVVYTPTASGFSPVVEGDPTEDGVDNTAVLQRCFETSQPIVDGPWVALPLRTEAGTVGVVAGVLIPSETLTAHRLRPALDELTVSLAPESLQLDTALLFASVQHEATADERRRVARELHDGVAQDLASLGYLVDDIADGAETPAQRKACAELRRELTSVVTELRRSLFVLRNELNDSVSLGHGVQALAAHLEARSEARIVVTADEGTKRLRPEVEAELLRIAQEGITNAVKHADASLIEVVVQVRAPDSTIVVRDDGRGLGNGRDDSHGLRIMRERAQRIGAGLTIYNREDGHGTELRVVLSPGTSSARAGIILEETTP